MRQLTGLVRQTMALAAVASVGVGTGLAPIWATALAAKVGALQQTACGTSGPELAAALGRLKHICPSPSDGMSVECMVALQERYWNKPVLCHAHANPAREFWKPIWWPKPRNDLLVWREVFENPSSLRADVHAAAANRACRLRGDEFRPDLRRTCAADAMARLGVLHSACQYALYMERGWGFEGWEREGDPSQAEPSAGGARGGTPSQAEPSAGGARGGTPSQAKPSPRFEGWRTYWQKRREAETLGNESYWQQVAVQQEAELHHAWRMAQCRQVPVAALVPLRELRPPSVYSSPFDQGDLLVVAAARLGSEWALAVGASSSRAGSHGNVAVEAWRDAPLPLAYLHWSHHAGLPYLLAARQADLASDAPRFDWRGWERGLADAHGADRVTAVSTVETIRAHGWPPCCARNLSHSPWPWADLPTPVRTKVVRRRIDQSGNVRWMYENGREDWLGDNVTHSAMPGGETWITYHSHIGRAVLRRWIDDEGTERWLDEWGDEHWIEADGTEHWIDLDGTEWILLPPERRADQEQGDEANASSNRVLLPIGVPLTEDKE